MLYISHNFENKKWQEHSPNAIVKTLPSLLFYLVQEKENEMLHCCPQKNIVRKHVLWTVRLNSINLVQYKTL